MPEKQVHILKDKDEKSKRVRENRLPISKEKVGTAEAAKMLGIARQTLCGWISSGRCPVPFYRHITGMYVFDKADIEAYLNVIRIEVMEADMK